MKIEFKISSDKDVMTKINKGIRDRKVFDENNNLTPIRAFGNKNIDIYIHLSIDEYAKFANDKYYLYGFFKEEIDYFETYEELLDHLNIDVNVETFYNYDKMELLSSKFYRNLKESYFTNGFCDDQTF